MAVIVSKGIVVPVRDKILSDYGEGEIVKLNENGSPVEFYVAKHDYESALNGYGRTLLVRKDCYTTGQWNSSNINAYSGSTIDTWLNGTYKGLLDSKVQDVISTTKFYYTPGNGNATVTELERSIFILSYTELNGTGVSATVEGTALDVASSLQIAYLNGSAVDQWTRSPNCVMNTVYVFYLYSNSQGYANGEYCNYSKGYRPCFTLPGTTLFDPNTNLFKG